MAETPVELTLRSANDLLNQASRALGRADEQQVKELLRQGIAQARDVLEETCRHLPADEEQAHELAVHCLGGGSTRSVSSERLVFDADDYDPSNPEAVLTGRMERRAQPPPKTKSKTATEGGGKSSGWSKGAGSKRGGGGSDGQPFEAASSSLDMVPEERFGIPTRDITASDLAQAMGIVRLVICDVRDQLLDLSEDDLDELSEAAILVATMLIGYGKGVTQTLAANTGVDLNARRPARPKSSTPELGQGKKGGNRGGDSGGGGDVDGEMEEEHVARGPMTGEDGRKRLPWDPVVVQLKDHAERLAKEGQKRPAAAVALVALALPVSWVALFLAPPIIVSDALMRVGIETPLGQKMGAAAEDVVVMSRFWYLICRVSAKQSLRFAKREFNRIGGGMGLLKVGKDMAGKVCRDPIGSAQASFSFAKATTGAAVEKLKWMHGAVTAMANGFNSQQQVE